MKILFLTRSTLFTQPGGDTLQVEQTAKYLRRLGYEIDIKLHGDTIELEKYELVHFFNLIRPADAVPILIKKIPLIISSIYHDYSNYDARHRQGLQKLLFKVFGKFGMEYLKTLGRWINGSDRFPGWVFLLSGQKKSIVRILKKTDFLIATSLQEINLIKKDLKIMPPHKKINLGSEHMDEVSSDQPRQGVLCAARIEGAKNQLNLIKALKDENVPLTLAGKAAANQVSYLQKCRDVADEWTIFTGHIPKDDLTRKFAEAKVHALISYYETTGLATVEALKLGCQAVITEYGAQKEIFGDKAFYCDPDDILSIKKAVKNALKNEDDHSEWAKENFSWEKAANDISDIYWQVTNKNHK